MARKINRRNFFVIDQVLNAVDRVQDMADRTTLRKYEDHQDYQKDKKEWEEARQAKKQQAEKSAELKEQLRMLTSQVEALLHAITDLKKRQAELDALKKDLPS